MWNQLVKWHSWDVMQIIYFYLCLYQQTYIMLCAFLGFPQEVQTSFTIILHFSPRQRRSTVRKWRKQESLVASAGTVRDSGVSWHSICPKYFLFGWILKPSSKTRMWIIKQRQGFSPENHRSTYEEERKYFWFLLTSTLAKLSLADGQLIPQKHRRAPWGVMSYRNCWFQWESEKQGKD